MGGVHLSEWSGITLIIVRKMSNPERKRGGKRDKLRERESSERERKKDEREKEGSRVREKKGRL
jgi:hypothetical protein